MAEIDDDTPYAGMSCAQAVAEYRREFKDIPEEFDIMLNRTRAALEIGDILTWEKGVKAGWKHAQGPGTSNYDNMKHEMSFDFLSAFHTAALLYLRYKPDWPHW